MNYPALTPPNNTSSSPGKDLLHLLRRRDKSQLNDSTSSSTGTDEIHQEILQLLYSLNTSIQRVGLLSSNRAAKIQINASSSSNNNEGSSKRKRKEGRHNNSNLATAAHYGIYLDSNSNIHNEERVDLEEGKILMGLCRILNVGTKNTNENNDDIAISEERYEIIQAACQVIISIGCHASNGNGWNCTVVRDMIGSIVIPLLDGLGSIISSMVQQKISISHIITNDALISVLEAASCVIRLVQTRCSQNKAGERTLQNLSTVAWSALNSTNDKVSKAAARLLATLPLAGDADNHSLSVLWSKSVKEGMMLMKLAVNDFFPIDEVKNDNSSKGSGEDTASSERHKTWMTTLKDSTDKTADNTTIDHHRRDVFLARIQSLTQYMLSLIQLKDYPIHHDNHNNLLIVSFPLQSLLNLSETLLTFPLAAEIKHRSLPPRLRSSPMEGGLLSPHAALSIAAYIQYCGQWLFHAIVSTSRSVAISHARRILSLSMSNLQYCMSEKLLSVVTNRKVMSKDNGRNPSFQLRNSICLRRKSVEMFQTVVLSLGSSVMSSTGTNKSVCRGVMLVGGCLLEMIQKCCVGPSGGVNNGDSCLDEEWGTLDERGSLM
jgi:hypothetical protein